MSFPDPKEIFKHDGEELWKLSACDMVVLLRQGLITPMDAIRSCADRISQTNPQINALIHVDIDAAMSAAQLLSACTQAERDSRPANFLHGLPIVVKDATMVKGWPITFGGSPLFEGHIAQRSDHVVGVLQRNGAIVLAISNSSEFTAGSNSFNPLHGTTFTPFDTRRTSGGSSGGGAAALAVGQVWLAQGSDLGGSLRTPAAFCGVVGIRPTPGLLANNACAQHTKAGRKHNKNDHFDNDAVGFMNLHSLDGPMARNVQDLAVMMDAMRALSPQEWGFHVPPLCNSDPDAFQQAVRTALSTGISNAGNCPQRTNEESKGIDIRDPDTTTHTSSTRIVFSPDMGGFCADMVDDEVASICFQACEWFSSGPSNGCEVISGPRAQELVRHMLTESCSHESRDGGDHYNKKEPCVSRETDMELIYSNAQLASIEAQERGHSTAQPSRRRNTSSPPHRWDARLIFHVLRGAKLARSFNPLLVSSIKHDNAGHLWPALVFLLFSLCMHIIHLGNNLSELSTLWIFGFATYISTIIVTMLAIGMASLVKPELRWNIQVGIETSAYIEHEAQKAHERLLGRVSTFFAENQLLVMPCVAVSPFDARDRYVWEYNTNMEEAMGLHNYVRWIEMTSLLSATNCPAITIPCGFTENGLPVGIQIVAAPFADEFALAAAACLESGYTIPGHPNTPSLASRSKHDSNKCSVTPVNPYCEQQGSDIVPIGPRSRAAAAQHHGIGVVHVHRWPFVVVIGLARAVVRLYHRRIRSI